MVLFVGVELTSGGRAARRASVAADDGRASLRARLERPRKQTLSEEFATAQPKPSAPPAHRGPNAARQLPSIASRQRDLLPQPGPAGARETSANIVLGPQLESDQPGPEHEGGRDHRVPSVVTGLRPRVEILPEPESFVTARASEVPTIEARLASIEQQLDRLGSAIAGQARNNTLPDPAKQAGELLKQLRQAGELAKLAALVPKLEDPETNDEQPEAAPESQPEKPEEPAPDGPRPDKPKPDERDPGTAKPPAWDEAHPAVNAQRKRLLGPVTKIYSPRYLSGSALLALVEPLLTAGSGKAGATDAATSRSKLQPPENAPPAPLGAVVVRDVPEVLRKIDLLIKQLDVPPASVVIEATVITIRLHPGMPQGIDLQEFNVSGQPFAVLPVDGVPAAGHGSNSARGTSEPLLTHGFGLKCGVLQGDPRAFIGVLQAAAQTRSAEAWQMTVLNGQSAQLMLNDPFGPQGSVPQAPAGTLLNIRPVLSNGLVHLDVRREVDLDAAAYGNRSAALTNQIPLQDGQTAVVAGFYAQHLAAHFYRTSLLGDVPLVGRLFRRESAMIERSETIVLLTPHVLRSAPTPAEQALRNGRAPAGPAERPEPKRTAGTGGIPRPARTRHPVANLPPTQPGPSPLPAAGHIPAADARDSNAAVAPNSIQPTGDQLRTVRPSGSDNVLIPALVPPETTAAAPTIRPAARPGPEDR